MMSSEHKAVWRGGQKEFRVIVRPDVLENEVHGRIYRSGRGAEWDGAIVVSPMWTRADQTLAVFRFRGFVESVFKVTVGAVELEYTATKPYAMRCGHGCHWRRFFGFDPAPKCPLHSFDLEKAL